jgi:UDP-3-O-[3-hydroxymyristoyl] glucosamine N-acyltransferase
MKVSEIAALVRGSVEGDPNIEIIRIATIDEAGPGALVFLSNPKYEKALSMVKAGAILLSRKLAAQVDRPESAAWIRVDDPYLSFVRCVAIFRPPRNPFPANGEIHPFAVLGERCKIGKNVTVGAFAVLGDEVTIGDHTRIMPGVKIGAGTRIGEHCSIYPNAVVLQNCVIGNRVILQPGCVIGMDGFGFAKRPDGSYEKFPQVGNVVIDDDVEIGANDSIARAALGETRIRRGVKLDSLVHIAPNCNIGEDSAFAALVGLSGSAKIGKRTVIAGQAGVAGHVELADDVVVGAQAGVMRSFLTPGEELAGYPARPGAERRREWAALGRLPALLVEFQRLRKEVEELKKNK